MLYNYDRRIASGKKWYDIQQEAEEGYITEAAKALASELKGTAKGGGFASAEVTFDGKTLKMGFKGAPAGTVYVIVPGKKNQKEYSVVNHTPQTFAALIARELKT